MTIVCGTDFSENAERAARAAAAIAKRVGEPLKLVHVLAEPLLLLSFAPSEVALQTALTTQAERLQREFGIEVEPVALTGTAPEALTEFASAAKASLLVLSALGQKKQLRWLVGSVAERVAQSSSLPVLIVRDASSIEAWVNGVRPLRVMLGSDLGPSALAALTWVKALRRIAPCDVWVVQVAWPIAEHARLGLKGPVQIEGLRPEVKEQLETELKAWTGTIDGEGNTSIVVSACWGRVDSHLVELATDARIDLLVVGTHQRAWAARAWLGSVSRGALHEALSNVACVPPARVAERDPL